MSQNHQIFSSYHSRFRGDMGDACACCGGKCEQYKIATLLPGEKYYMASHFAMPLSEFEDRYLDRLNTPYGLVDVLKMKDRCPFLDTDYACLAAPVKPVLCDSYPIIFDIKGSRVQFRLDRQNCPAVGLERYSASVRNFASQGIKALRDLNIPSQWWKLVLLYDSYDYDYAAFESERTRPGYETFLLETVLGYACNGHEKAARRMGIKLLSIRFKDAAKYAVAQIDNRKSNYSRHLRNSDREFVRTLYKNISMELSQAASSTELQEKGPQYFATIAKIKNAIGDIESRIDTFIENKKPAPKNISISRITPWIMKETGS